MPNNALVFFPIYMRKFGACSRELLNTSFCSMNLKQHVIQMHTNKKVELALLVVRQISKERVCGDK